MKRSTHQTSRIETRTGFSGGRWARVPVPLLTLRHARCQWTSRDSSLSGLHGLTRSFVNALYCGVTELLSEHVVLFLTKASCCPRAHRYNQNRTWYNPRAAAHTKAAICRRRWTSHLRVRKRPIRATLLLIPHWRRRSLCRSVLGIYRGSPTYSWVLTCFRPHHTVLGTRWAYSQCTGTPTHWLTRQQTHSPSKCRMDSGRLRR